jgi:hypothetical protein
MGLFVLTLGGRDLLCAMIAIVMVIVDEEGGRLMTLQGTPMQKLG